MAVIFPPDGPRVPHEDVAALLREMADKPGNWRVFSANPETSTYTLMADIGEAYVSYKVQLDTAPLFALNHEDEVESNGKRFGDGQVVARVPEHLLFSNEAGNIGQAFAEDDRKHVRKILNDGDFSRFRSFRGKL